MRQKMSANISDKGKGYFTVVQIMQWNALTQRLEFFYLCGATQLSTAESADHSIQCESALRAKFSNKNLANFLTDQLKANNFIVLVSTWNGPTHT